MQIVTRLSREINRCGDYEDEYCLYNFDSVPDEDLKKSFLEFCDIADGEVILDSSEGKINPNSWSSFDHKYNWNEEKKCWWEE